MLPVFSYNILCHWHFEFCFQTKKVKVATKGAKQIVEENASTLNFYRNMIFGAVAIHLTLTFLLFEFTTLIFVSLNDHYLIH